MSRTYRRKAGKPRQYHLTDGYRDPDTWVWVDVPLDKDEQIKVINKYHSDHGKWMGDNLYKTAPKHYRQTLERVRRAKEKNTLVNIIKAENYDNYTFDVYKNDAGWNWW